MFRLFRFLVVLGFMFGGSYASASQEGMLAWSEFAISSPGIGESGPVKISGMQTSEGIASLKISAFRREHVASVSQLQELQGFSANGLLLSYEKGYRELGGRTLYLGFVKGFTSGVQTKKVITFNEVGEIKLLKEPGK